MNATHDIREESRKDPDALKREIDATRADVGQTLDALQARLSPGQILDQAMGLVQRHGGELARNLGSSVKDNPLAMLLTGVGLTWLIASGNSSRRYDDEDAPYEELGVGEEPLAEELTEEDFTLQASTGNGEAAGDGDGLGTRIGEKASATRERARERIHAARERFSNAAGSASASARRVRERARYRAGRTREGMNRMLEEQPLVLGIIGVAVGAIIAAALPSTRREDEMLGEARDRVLHRAKAAGAEQMERVREAARSTDDVEASEHDQRTGRAPPEMGDGVVYTGSEPRVPPDVPPAPPEPYISRPP